MARILERSLRPGVRLERIERTYSVHSRECAGQTGVQMGQC